MCISWLLPIIPGPLLLTLAVALTAAGMDLTLDLCYVSFQIKCKYVIKLIPMLTEKTFVFQDLSPTFVNSINTIIKIIGNTSGIIISLCVGQVTYKFKVISSTVVVLREFVSLYLQNSKWCCHVTSGWLNKHDLISHKTIFASW